VNVYRQHRDRGTPGKGERSKEEPRRILLRVSPGRAVLGPRHVELWKGIAGRRQGAGTAGRNSEKARSPGSKNLRSS